MADKKSPASGWPIAKGDFHSGDANSPVAVVTMGSHLDEKGICDAGAAICGSCKTENLGLEKVIANIISNPNIRFMLTCGTEVKGHLSGQTMKALHKTASRTAGSSVLKVQSRSSRTSTMTLSSGSRSRSRSSISWRPRMSAPSRPRSTNSRHRIPGHSLPTRWSSRSRRPQAVLKIAAAGVNPAVPRDREAARQDREEDRVRGCRDRPARRQENRSRYRYTLWTGGRA